jgi:hypothetical protein
MRRILGIGASISFVAMVLPGVVSATSDQPNQGACVSAAKDALRGTGITFNVGQFDKVILGTNGIDLLGPELTEGADLICGFGDADRIFAPAVVGAGDMFVAGPSGVFPDVVAILDGGVVIGGPGHNVVETMRGGVFIAGDDDGVNQVGDMYGGTLNGPGAVGNLYGGTFNGGPDFDQVIFTLDGGTFNGGAGRDVVPLLRSGTFNGGPGDDFVGTMWGGTFDGDGGFDVVGDFYGGTLIDVP